MNEMVVGVDGSAGCQAAIVFAFEEASWRKARVHAVHTWTHPVSTEPGDMLPLIYDKESVAADERRLLAESRVSVSSTPRRRPSSVTTGRWW
jgi:hypothetical protein